MSKEKIIFLDADGVVLKQHEYFSERLSREYDIPLADISAFFHGEFNDCVIGKTDLKEALEPYMKKWHWTGTVEGLLAYWFDAESEINQDVITFVKKLRLRGTKVFLVSQQEKYRKEYILNTIGLVQHFDGSFFSCDLHYKKKQKEFYKKVLAELGNPSLENIFFWDDDRDNITAAKAAGINAYFYEGLGTLKSQVI